MSLEVYLHARKIPKMDKSKDMVMWTWQESNRAKWPGSARPLGAHAISLICGITSPRVLHHPSMSVWSNGGGWMCHGSMGPPSYSKTMQTTIPTSIWASIDFTTTLGVHPRSLDGMAVDPRGGRPLGRHLPPYFHPLTSNMPTNTPLLSSAVKVGPLALESTSFLDIKLHIRI